MSITLNISPLLQQELEKKAAAAGQDTSIYAGELLERSLKSREFQSPLSADREAELVKMIVENPLGDDMDRFLDLIKKRRDETIRPDELEQFHRFSEMMEQFRVTRLEALTELAQLRGTTVPQEMERLEIRPPNVL